MSRIVSGVVASAIALGLVVLGAAPAGAHEQRKVGAYQLTIGWQQEPTYAGVLNAVQLFINDAKGNPVDDLGSPTSLQLTVSTGTKTSDPLDIEPSFDPDTNLGTHGEFDAAVIPTAPGTYTFHLTGSIKGQKVDEKFTSSDKTFNDVQAPTAVEFPNQEPSNAELATNLTRVDAREQRAADQAKSSHALAVGALVAAIVLGGGGLVVGFTRGRRHA
jgi:hypothetical protein